MVEGGKIQDRKFNVLVFWADPVIKAKYRIRFRIFLGNMAALSQEATSEITFSLAGRAYTKARACTAPEKVCDHVVCRSGERVAPTSSSDVLAMYKKIAAEALGRKAAATAAATAAAAAARVAADAAAAASAAAEAASALEGGIGV